MLNDGSVLRKIYITYFHVRYFFYAASCRIEEFNKQSFSVINTGESHLGQFNIIQRFTNVVTELNGIYMIAWITNKDLFINAPLKEVTNNHTLVVRSTWRVLSVLLYLIQINTDRIRSDFINWSLTQVVSSRPFRLPLLPNGVVA